MKKLIFPIILTFFSLPLILNPKRLIIIGTFIINVQLLLIIQI